MNSTQTQSTSYTSLMMAGERTGVITYDGGRGLEWGPLAFSMRSTLKSDDADRHPVNAQLYICNAAEPWLSRQRWAFKTSGPSAITLASRSVFY